MKRLSLFGSVLLSTIITVGCSSSDGSVEPLTWEIGDPTATDYPEDYYAGGQLGTTAVNTATAFEQPTKAVVDAGMMTAFNEGEYLFEKDYNTNTDGAFHGLGPVFVRRGCLYCHPGYGHGARQTEYKADNHRNGYLLVIYDKTTNAYIRSVAGMPQTVAVKPFKAPIDENQIKIAWNEYTDEWGNKFPDGETYSLIYPEVTIPYSAYYAPVAVGRGGSDVILSEDEYNNDVVVRLESTIGIYGTGLTDAIPDADITAQWEKEGKYFNSIGKTDALNPAMWDQANGKWNSYYSNSLQGDGTNYVRRYTYAMSRGPLMDAAGVNAIWNITNVTRSDRRYHYLDLAGTYYATQSSKDPEVQAGFTEYITRLDPLKKHPEWHTGNLEKDIYTYLTSKQQDVEMTDEQFKNFAIWHRGLAVPAARNTTTEDFKKGKELFSQIGCAACHRPSWETGDDHLQDPNKFFKDDSELPRYPHQKIWPYTDFVQHRLWMKNDLRTGWCRTTPLWGRGLAAKCGSGVERLHDCRARNVLEAIMWHGCRNEGGTSDAYNAVTKFRSLSKKERDQLIFFIESI
ncbi:di-heme oxidoredictase family protein [Xylanibacter brevis]|uniref:di-heme oxidoredictase family protein n=1 Tax=Xylanibacter brevis TaxID=83231 RepID=UPI0004896075|nr:di-heme oxidoredictase family protein [Xylanibacter brevis]